MLNKGNNHMSIQPRMWLASFTARAHTCFTFNMLSSRTSPFLQYCFLDSHYQPALLRVINLSQIQDFAFAFTDFMRFPSADFSSLLMYFWTAALPTRVLAASLTNWEMSENALYPITRSLIKVLNSICSIVNRLGIPITIGCKVFCTTDHKAVASSKMWV